MSIVFLKIFLFFYKCKRLTNFWHFDIIKVGSARIFFPKTGADTTKQKP